MERPTPPLTPEQITMGLVCSFDQVRLEADDRVIVIAPGWYKGTFAPSHPFVCLAVKDGQALWVPLTSTCKYGDRMKVKPEWRVGHSRRWTSGECFLFSPEVCYVGPLEAFSDASWAGEVSSTADRWITPDGCLALLKAVNRGTNYQATRLLTRDPADRRKIA